MRNEEDRNDSPRHVKGTERHPQIENRRARPEEIPKRMDIPMCKLRKLLMMIAQETISLETPSASGKMRI